MEFHLTYSGPLLGSNVGRDERPARKAYKHRLRRMFHRQLSVLWNTHPTLARRVEIEGKYNLPYLSANWVRDGFNWVPLVSEHMELVCGINALMLCKYHSKTDIDNRLKTVFDVLQMPVDADQLGSALPRQEETPFFVLLENDKLVTTASVRTAPILEPVRPEEWADIAQSEDEVREEGAAKYGEENMVRLVLDVSIRTSRTHMSNIDFN